MEEGRKLEGGNEGVQQRDGGEWRRAYAETMAAGAREYADVIERLGELGLPASFTQTGGMCAAIEVTLEAGAYLLITDAEDTLSWSRAEHEGWAVGLYLDDRMSDGGVERFAATEESDIDALTNLVIEVLRGRNDLA
ncbi:hypothetical protein [Actinocorallia aurantiaca]|uniref:DUF5753 domain-containing protein n=1 Tax=Actinocorallia aurantiaca TaxID=46204 RepID=A0ABN3UKH0_9ACTN